MSHQFFIGDLILESEHDVKPIGFSGVESSSSFFIHKLHLQVRRKISRLRAPTQVRKVFSRIVTGESPCNTSGEEKLANHKHSSASHHRRDSKGIAREDVLYHIIGISLGRSRNVCLAEGEVIPQLEGCLEGHQGS